MQTGQQVSSRDQAAPSNGASTLHDLFALTDEQILELFKDIQTQNSFIPVLQMTGSPPGAFVGNIDIEDVTPADFPTSIFAVLLPFNGVTAASR